MVLYPIFSVYPQEIAFRGMVHHRYRVVFVRFLGTLGPGAVRIALVLMSAVVFSWAHVVMLNPWAIGFCLIGGLLFADTYERSRSLAAVSIEHALYGCWMFTAGWGYYFYAGGAAMAA
jgi:membrane protease YdiL (CAAX protease family)